MRSVRPWPPLRRPLRIVGIGGGTGLPLLMQGLAALEAEGEAPELCLTAIVCVSDDGGSSGRLRKAYHVPALGDVRNCLLSLAPEGSLLSELFQYRFPSAKGLGGHALGNLILTALCQQTGSLRKAIDAAAHGMRLGGTVLPVTEEAITLCAQGIDGRRARGECRIVAERMRIARVWLEPEAPPPARGVLESIDAADVIVLGPGSLFTSVVPPLLVDGVADAIRRSTALRIYVCNLMVEPGETDGFGATDHVRALTRSLGEEAIDVCVQNGRSLETPVARRYLAAGATPIEPDRSMLETLGVTPIVAELILEEGPKARHDPAALGRLVLELSERRHELRQSRRMDALCAELSVT